MTLLFWPNAFLVIGLLLLILEVLVPSGGFIGLSALVCVGLSLWHAFQHSTQFGMIYVVIDLAAVPLTMAAAFWIWTRSPLSRKLFLQPPEPEEIDVSHAERNLPLIVGRAGRALTPLHPCGHLEIDGRRYDGLAEEGFIPEGAVVRVVRARSGQLIVRVERPVADPDPDADLDLDPSPLEPLASVLVPTEHPASLIEESP
jgi:membrane-bound serine protease (ClpP class)